MASFAINRTGNTSKYINFSGSYNVSVSGTTVTISVSASVSKSSSSSSHTWGTYNASITVAGATQSVGNTSFDIAPGGSQGLISKTFTFTNQSPGTHNYGISVSIGGDVMWGSGSATASATIANPAPTNVNINPVASGRTSINLNRSWSGAATTCQYNINGWGWINENTSYSNGVHVNGNTVSNLTPNTSYSCQIRMYNGSAGPTTSSSKSATTSGNPPTIGTETTAFSGATTALNSKKVATISYATTYDTNASYSSHTLVYGTSTSYGSAATSTGTDANSSFTLNNLEQRTTYYYKITETDNFSRSSTKTGSFTTPPGVKVITTDGVINAAVKVIQ